MHRLNFYISTLYLNLSHAFWCSSATVLELSPSNYLLKIQPHYFLSSTLQGINIHYQQSDTYLIKRAIEFDWEKSLSNLDANKQVFVFKETIMNIFENFIPHKTITPNDKDPPWMNKQIKTLITEKNGLYKRLKQKLVNTKLLDKLAG